MSQLDHKVCRGDIGDGSLYPNEMNEINHSERIARRMYYQKMEEDSLPKEESLKWIRKIKEQLRDEEMSCEHEN